MFAIRSAAEATESVSLKAVVTPLDDTPVWMTPPDAGSLPTIAKSSMGGVGVGTGVGVGAGAGVVGPAGDV